MTTYDASLAAKFAVLKRTAICVDDVATWFRNNPDCIPDMPAIFRENTQVKVSAARTMLDPNLEPPGVVTYLTLMVDVRVEPTRNNTITDDDFENATGQVIRIQRSRADAAWYAGEFVLPLLAMDWPMVAAQQAHYVLNNQLAPDDCWYTHAKQSWAAHFTSVPWDTLVNLQASALLPTVEEEFIAWAVPSTDKPKTELELPGDFAGP